MYKTGTLAKDCNQKLKLTLDISKQIFSPATSIFHEFAFDETAKADETAKVPDEDILPLNEDVHKRLEANSDWRQNYSFKGAVWINNSERDFKVGQRFDATLLAGEKMLSNVTMETFTQSTKNCFSCHNTAIESNNDLGVDFPAKRLSISHVLTNAYFNSQKFKINIEKIKSQKLKGNK